MPDVTASRTLVKSAPELWTECSDADALGRHLDQFGDIRITRLEPETAVAWEGEHASGTVRLEPSGWGTRVVLTATPVSTPEAAPSPEPTPSPEPAPSREPAPVAEATAAVEAGEPVVVEDPGTDVLAAGPEAAGTPAAAEAPAASETPEPKAGFFGRLFGRFRRRPEPPVESLAEPEAEAEPAATAEARVESPVEPVVAVDEPVDSAEPEPEESRTPEGGSLDPEAALMAALDSLGQAHHRPYSRA